MSKPDDAGQARISRLRELLEADEDAAPGAGAAAPPPGGDRSRLPLAVAVGGGALVVLLLVFLLLSGDDDGSAPEVPQGTSETSVSVFPSPDPGQRGQGAEGQHLRPGEPVAEDVVVVERHIEDQLVAGQLVVLDIFATPEEVGRLSDEKAADLRVVRGSCGTAPTPPTTAPPTTAPPPTTPPPAGPEPAPVDPAAPPPP